MLSHWVLHVAQVNFFTYISGFTVVYFPHPAEEFTGWPGVSYVFGNYEDTQNFQVSFSKDLEELWTCS